MALVERMAESLQLPKDSILALARKADYSYFRFTVPKRGDGAPRVIDHPSRPLKGLQRWLLHNLVAFWPVHDAAHAYVPGRGIKENARAHVGSRFLLRMDLRDFFPSIRWADIQLYLEGGPPGTDDWDEEDRLAFGRIVCRNARLTIGAPTSPALSNVICYDLDRQLAATADEFDLSYTRYADDLFFSSEVPDVLRDVEHRVADVISELPCPRGLQINPGKTRHSSKKRRRQVTGLVLASDGIVRMGRSRKRYIRRQLYRLNDLTEPELRELSGLLAFAMDIEPDFINAVTIKYGAAVVTRARRGTQ